MSPPPTMSPIGRGPRARCGNSACSTARAAATNIPGTMATAVSASKKRLVFLEMQGLPPGSRRCSVTVPAQSTAERHGDGIEASPPTKRTPSRPIASAPTISCASTCRCSPIPKAYHLPGRPAVQYKPGELYFFHHGCRMPPPISAGKCAYHLVLDWASSSTARCSTHLFPGPSRHRPRLHGSRPTPKPGWKGRAFCLPRIRLRGRARDQGRHRVRAARRRRCSVSTGGIACPSLFAWMCLPAQTAPQERPLISK